VEVFCLIFLDFFFFFFFFTFPPLLKTPPKLPGVRGVPTTQPHTKTKPPSFFRGPPRGHFPPPHPNPPNTPKLVVFFGKKHTPPNHTPQPHSRTQTRAHFFGTTKLGFFFFPRTNSFLVGLRVPAGVWGVGSSGGSCF